MTDEIIDISEVTPAKKNARRHTERTVGTIEQSIKQDGTGRSILLDENLSTIAGHGTIKAAKRAGVKRIRLIRPEKDELVAVVREGLTDEQKLRLQLADNRAGDHSFYDAEVLAEFKDSNPEVVDQLWTDDEQERLFKVDQRVENVPFERPPDLVWVLLSIPVAAWPDAQAKVAELEAMAGITVQATRRDERKDGQA